MYCERYGYDVKKNLGACTAGSPVPGVGNPINTGIYNKFQLEDDFTFGAGIHQRVIGRAYNSSKVSEEGAVYAVPQPVLFGPHWARRAVRPSPGRLLVRCTAPRTRCALTARRTSSTSPVRYESGSRCLRHADPAGRCRRHASRWTSWRRRHRTWRLPNLSVAASRSSEPGLVAAIDLFYAGDRLETVRDAFGRELISRMGPTAWFRLCRRRASARISTATTRYNLTEIKQPNGAIRRYHYENATFGNALTGISDDSAFATPLMDTTPMAAPTLTQLAGGVNRYTIAQVGALRIPDPRNSPTDQGFVNVQGVAKIASSTQPCASCGGSGAGSAYAYDANGNITSRTDFNGRKTCYAYDATRNLETARVEGLTAAEDCAASLATPPDAAGRPQGHDGLARDAATARDDRRAGARRHEDDGVHLRRGREPDADEDRRAEERWHGSRRSRGRGSGPTERTVACLLRPIRTTRSRRRRTTPTTTLTPASAGRSRRSPVRSAT